MCRPRCHAICNPGIGVATEKTKVGASDMYQYGTYIWYVRTESKNGIDTASTQLVRQMIHGVEEGRLNKVATIEGPLLAILSLPSSEIPR